MCDHFAHIRLIFVAAVLRVSKIPGRLVIRNHFVNRNLLPSFRSLRWSRPAPSDLRGCATSIARCNAAFALPILPMRPARSVGRQRFRSTDCSPKIERFTAACANRSASVDDPGKQPARASRHRGGSRCPEGQEEASSAMRCLCAS